MCSAQSDLRALPQRRLKILDVGCGSGRDVAAFRAAGHDAGGIDPCDELLDVARREKLPVICASADGAGLYLQCGSLSSTRVKEGP